jgi:hypothetical protein
MVRAAICTVISWYLGVILRYDASGLASARVNAAGAETETVAGGALCNRIGTRRRATPEAIVKVLDDHAGAAASRRS